MKTLNRVHVIISTEGKMLNADVGDMIIELNTYFKHQTALLREAFKNKNDETYGIFHMLVDPPLPTNGQFFRDFFIVVRISYLF